MMWPTTGLLRGGSVISRLSGGCHSPIMFCRMDRDRVIKTAMVSMATFVRQNWEVATPQSCSTERTETE